MGSELLEIILPSFAFFMAFFLASVILEMGVVILLNRFFFNHWSSVVKLARAREEKWHRHVELSLCFLLSASILAAIASTQVIDVLQASPWEIKIYALELCLATFLIYWIVVGMLTKDAGKDCRRFLRKAHFYIFFFISALIAIYTLLLIDRSYEGFKRFIRATLVYPVTGGPTLILESGAKLKLLSAFRKQIRQGFCPWVDYSEHSSESPVVNLVYVTTHDDLRTDPLPINHYDPKEYLSGRACSKGDTTFLITEHGQWYWVIDEDRIREKIGDSANKPPKNP